MGGVKLKYVGRGTESLDRNQNPRYSGVMVGGEMEGLLSKRGSGEYVTYAMTAS